MTEPRGFYFFLSYAAVPPVPRLPVETTPRDPLVDTFFTDLLSTVRRLARSGARRIGVYDRSISPGTDWKDILRALGEAEVLVPLYSPRYVASAWATEEHYSFVKRLEAAHADPGRHIQPVLWMPFPAGEDPAAYGLQDLDEDVSQPYKEFGLGALLDQAPDPEFRTVYRRIVEQVAQRIVHAAEETPIGPSALPRELGAVPIAPAAADFLVVVYQAPGVAPGDWDPFSEGRHVPIAGHALGVTRRIDVVAAVATLREAVRLWRHRPAVLLLDVWLLDDDETADEVARILSTLPRWVIPLVIADGDDRAHATRVAELRELALDMLGDGTDRAMSVAGSAESFEKIMPVMISQARSRYLHELPSSFPRRPRLGMARPRRMPARGEDR